MSSQKWSVLFSRLEDSKRGNSTSNQPLLYTTPSQIPQPVHEDLWYSFFFKIPTWNSAITDKPRNAFRGQSRSPNMVPFHNDNFKIQDGGRSPFWKSRINAVNCEIETNINTTSAVHDTLSDSTGNFFTPSMWRNMISLLFFRILYQKLKEIRISENLCYYDDITFCWSTTFELQ